MFKNTFLLRLNCNDLAKQMKEYKIVYNFLTNYLLYIKKLLLPKKQQQYHQHQYQHQQQQQQRKTQM